MGIDARLHAEHAERLGVLADILDERGIAAELLEPSNELPVTTLMVSLGEDDKNNTRILAISIMPLGADDLQHLQLVQYYVQLPFKIKKPALASVQRGAAIVNAAVAIGNFGTQGNEVFYRYVHAMSASDAFDAGGAVELVGILGFHQEHFGALFEALNDEEIGVADLPSILAGG